MIQWEILVRLGYSCALLALVFTLSACGAGLQTLQLSDRALMPSARVSKNLVQPDRTLAASQVQTTLAVEGGIVGASGRTPTFVFAQAVVGGQTFLPPQTIDTEFDFRVADISMHWRHALFGRRIGYDLAGGLAWGDLDFLAASPGVQAREDISSPALRLVAGAFVRVYRETNFEAEATALVSNDNFTGFGGHRFSIVQKLGRHVTVNGGYFSWDVETSNTSRSRLDIHLQGPLIGVNVKF